MQFSVVLGGKIQQNLDSSSHLHLISWSLVSGAESFQIA